MGASTLKMADLRAIAEELGLQSVRTLLASGNLLFTSNASEQPLQNWLEERVGLHIGRNVRVMLRTSEELDAVCRTNPFPEVPGSTVQVFFLNEPPPAGLLESVRNVDDERIAAGVREVYVAYGEKAIGRSRLRIPVAEAGTARNMNTVAKLAELAREMS